MNTTATDYALNPDLLDSLNVGRVFNDNTAQITSLDFDDTGDLLITASDDETLRIYDCLTGTSKGVLNSKKYGCTLARFTHRATSVIYASTKDDDSIRYLSVHDNKFLRYFKGHNRRVTSLELNPRDDTFISASEDRTVRVWELRQAGPIGTLNLEGKRTDPVVAYEHTGIAFALGIEGHIKLFEMRKWKTGPFKEFAVPGDPYLTPWTSIRFSNNGKFMMITTGTVIYIMDAYHGAHVCTLEGIENPAGVAIPAGFTADARFCYSGDYFFYTFLVRKGDFPAQGRTGKNRYSDSVSLSGSANGPIRFWKLEGGGECIAKLTASKAPTKLVEFNPKYLMFASADSSL
ncbi:WD repeat-containing protein 82, partial [Blyttiomyces helicus]